MTRIEEMYVFVINPTGHREGIPGLLSHDGNWMPLVGADMDRVSSLMPMAQRIADENDCVVEVRHFTQYEVIHKIHPQPEPEVAPEPPKEQPKEETHARPRHRRAK